MKNSTHNRQTLSSPTRPSYRLQDWGLGNGQENYKPLSSPTGDGRKMFEPYMTDLTILYATAHKVPEYFREKIVDKLYENSGNYPILEIHTWPENSSIEHYYKELLVHASMIDTPYIAFAEDDCLYPDEHFNFRPTKPFGYNFNRWNIHTWSDPPFFYLKQRRILATLIADRKEFIKVMKGRTHERMFEPGRGNEEWEAFETYNPVVVFTHPDAFGYLDGKKRAGKIRALEIPYFGKASDIMKLYVKE